jgi:DNA-binding transcriptional LysR family regulator
VLAAFLAANTHVDLDLDERPSPEVASAVSEGLADVGVAADHADLSGLQTFSFRRDRLVLVMAPQHGLAGRRCVPFADALGSDFIGLSTDSALQHHLAGHAARAGVPMRLRARVRSLDVACRMASLGAGVAVVPEAAARRWATGRALGVVQIEDAWAERRLLVVVRQLDALSAHARRLVEHLVASTSVS